MRGRKRLLTDDVLEILSRVPASIEAEHHIRDLMMDFGKSVDRDWPSIPIQAMGNILAGVQAYQQAVVRANAPRGFPSSPTPADREALRQHRQSQLMVTDKKMGLGPLRKFLTHLNCDDVLGDEPWTVNNSLWERELWAPLRAWVERGWELLREADDCTGGPAVIPLGVQEQWEKQADDIRQRILLRQRDFGWPPVAPAAEETSPATSQESPAIATPPANEDEKSAKEAKRPPKSRLIAWALYEWVIENKPGLKTDKEVYEYLLECEEIPGDAPVPPNFKTFQRYLTEARRFYGKSKHTPRAGRSPGRSIVRQKDLDYKDRSLSDADSG